VLRNGVKLELRIYGQAESMLHPHVSHTVELGGPFLALAKGLRLWFKRGHMRLVPTPLAGKAHVRVASRGWQIALPSRRRMLLTTLHASISAPSTLKCSDENNPSRARTLPHAPQFSTAWLGMLLVGDFGDGLDHRS
jgi:hypothetical protein